MMPSQNRPAARAIHISRGLYSRCMKIRMTSVALAAPNIRPTAVCHGPRSRKPAPTVSNVRTIRATNTA
jgi:hypothetical protein